MRARATTAVVLCLLLVTACAQDADFEIRTTARIDVDALVVGAVEPGTDRVDVPGGLDLVVELSREIDLIRIDRDAAGLILDGGRIEDLSLRYTIVNNASTAAVPQLRFLVALPDDSDPRAAFPVAMLPGAGQGSTELFGDPVWLSAGRLRLVWAVEQIRFDAFLTGVLELDEGDPIPTGTIDLALVISGSVEEI